MSKFAKKTAAPATKETVGEKITRVEKSLKDKGVIKDKKPKLWTNKQEWQDQETGVTTEAGKAQQAKVAAKTGAKQDDDAPAAGKKALPAAKDLPKLKTAKDKAAPAKAAPKNLAKAGKNVGAARAGRADPFADSKIKLLKKDYKAREGSNREKWFKAVASSKTVAEARGKAEGLDASVLRWMEADGIASFA